MLEADRYTAVANYYAAEALLARILLDEGKYEDAKTTALDVINSGKFHLVDAEKASMYLLTLSIISLLTSKFCYPQQEHIRLFQRPSPRKIG